MSLFKYCSWVGQHTKDKLRQLSVYMSKAELFNDLADCLPSFDKNTTDDDAKKAFLSKVEITDYPI